MFCHHFPMLHFKKLFLKISYYKENTESVKLINVEKKKNTLSQV